MLSSPVTKNNICKPSFKANPMPKAQAQHIDKKLKEARSVDIFCHSSTDEDAFNSAKVMYLYLEQMGKKPRIIASNNPDLYEYDRQRYNILFMKNVNKNIKKADLALCVDFSKNERVLNNALDYLHEFPEDKIIGMDHHFESDYIIADTRAISKSYDSVKQMPQAEPSNYYIDSSSKSCSAIIYRFFEALNKKLSDRQLSSLFCGMCDDIKKQGVVDYKKSSDNTYECELTGSEKLDSNTREVFGMVDTELSNQQKHKIIKHLDILSNLSKDENAFMKRLFDGVKFSDNGRFAYFAIEPDDKDWMKFGGDTNRTSAMIRDFRIRLLKNSPDDSLISMPLSEKLNGIETSGVFYPDYDEDAYKQSLHSKKDYVAKYQSYVRNNLYPELIAGGHANRGGGRILTLDKDECREWVGYFKEASENVQY